MNVSDEVIWEKNDLIPYLHSLFRHNELILRDKRLLFVEQPVRKIGEKLRSARDEISIELFLAVADLFAAQK